MILFSSLHIQGEADKGLWFNGVETGKGKLDFLKYANPQPPIINAAGLRDTVHGLTYSAWDENKPANPSTLKKWADNLGLEHSGYEEYSKYYIYNFDPSGDSEKILIGVRIKGCGHGVRTLDYQYNFFRIFSDKQYSVADHDADISQDTETQFC